MRARLRVLDGSRVPSGPVASERLSSVRVWCRGLCAGDHVTLLREESMTYDQHRQWLRTRPGEVAP